MVKTKAEPKTLGRPRLQEIVLRYGAGWPQFLTAWITLNDGGHRWGWEDDQPPHIYYVPDVATANTLYPQNASTIWIGFGGGAFDVRDSKGNIKEEGKTEADLVADHLGVLGRPDLQLMLDSCRYATFGPEVVKIDRDEEWENVHRDMTLGRLIGTVREYGVVPKEDEGGNVHSPVRIRTLRHELAQRSAFQQFDAIFAKAYEFHVLCPQDFDQTGKFVRMGELNVAFVESDLQAMNAWCRTVKKANVVVIRSIVTGHMQLFTDNNKGQKEIILLAQAILEAEHEALQLHVDVDSLIDTLDAMYEEKLDGPIPGAPHWHVSWKSGWCLNRDDALATHVTFKMLEYYLFDILVTRPDEDNNDEEDDDEEYVDYDLEDVIE